MKKSTLWIITLAIVLVIVLIVVSGPLSAVTGNIFNKQIFDLTYGYDRAVGKLPNGEVIDGKVQSWTDYEDGDQIQVKIDGKTYLFHSTNIVLIAD